MAGAGLRKFVAVTGAVLWPRPRHSEVLKLLKPYSYKMFQELTESLERSLQEMRGHSHGHRGRVFVALSGGADSTALLHSAQALLHGGDELYALHADHQLHANSEQWRSHCQALCRSLGVPLIAECLSIAAEGNLEAAARRARYEFFARHLGPNDILMLAHHRQDQLESVLLRLFQGRGVMPMRGQGALGVGHFVRPFMNIEKQLLTQYLVSHDVGWIEDPSNRDLAFDRNYLRHRVTGEILARWPNVRSAVQRVSESALTQQQLLVHLVSKTGDTVPWSELPAAPDLALAWLRTYLGLRGHHDVSDASMGEFLRQQTQGARAQLELGSDRLYAWRDTLYFERVSPNTPTVRDHLTVSIPTSVDWGRYQLAFTECSESAANAIAYAGELRLTCRDRLQEHPSVAQSSLKKRLQQAQIPPWQRGTYPICLDAAGLVVIPGVWRRSASALSSTAAMGFSTEAKHCTIICKPVAAAMTET